MTSYDANNNTNHNFLVQDDHAGVLAQLFRSKIAFTHLGQSERIIDAKAASFVTLIVVTLIVVVGTIPYFGGVNPAAFYWIAGFMFILVIIKLDLLRFQKD